MKTINLIIVIIFAGCLIYLGYLWGKKADIEYLQQIENSYSVCNENEFINYLGFNKEDCKSLLDAIYKASLDRCSEKIDTHSDFVYTKKYYDACTYHLFMGEIQDIFLDHIKYLKTK